MNLKIKFELEETELKGEIENLIPSSSGGSLPSGGTTGQVLTKNSNADGDAGWKDAVQSDWNENDEGSPAFVKNRTHYTEYENQFQFDYNEDSHSYAITFSVALDTDKTYELVYDYDIENDAGVQATTLIKWNVINPVTYKGSWVGKFTQKTKYGSTFWCFNDIHPADSSLLPCIYSSDMKTFTGFINSCVNNEAWLNEVKIAVPLDLKYIPETIARASDTVMGTGEEQHFGSAVEEQICSNIGALYRDDLNGYLSDKVDKNQGTANSGKLLGIGADGIVVPTDVGGGGSSDISFPLLYEATTTEEVRWIDTGANAFRAKRRLIIQLISKATSSNSADNTGCGSIYTDGSPISSAFANYVLTNGMTAMLPKQYDRLNTFYGYRANDDASWIFYHTNRTVVNAGSTALNCANQNSAVSKKDITGFIIGDNSAAVNEGTRVFGIGTEIKVWGV